MLATADRGDAARRHIAHVVTSLEDLSAEDVLGLLGHVEELRARLWRKMLVSPPATTPDHPSQSRLMTVYEVAAILRYSRGHIYELIRSGDLKAVKNGRSVRITADAVAAWQERHGRTGVDAAYSVSLDSPRDRRSSKARPAGTGIDPARVRQAPGRSPGDRRQVGDGRAGYPRARSEAHNDSGRRRRIGESEEPSEAASQPQRRDLPAERQEEESLTLWQAFDDGGAQKMTSGSWTIATPTAHASA